MRDDGRRGPLGPEWACIGAADPSMACWWPPSFPCLDLLLTCDSSLRAAPTTSVGARSLAANRQAPAMAAATVRADLGHSLDVHRDLAPKVALDQHFFGGGHAVDDLAEPADLLLGEVFDSRVSVEVGHLHELFGSRPADPVDVHERDHHPLLRGYVDAGDTRHLAQLLH